jgi:hypothetical protein
MVSRGVPGGTGRKRTLTSATSAAIIQASASTVFGASPCAPQALNNGRTNMKPEGVYTASKDQLNLVLSFFSRVDSKLSVVLAIDTGMLAVLGADAPPLKALSWAMMVFAGFAVALIGVSIAFLYRGAFPSLKGGNSSLIYFREIAKRTEHQFIEQFKQQNDEQHVDDLLAQVWRNSEILKAKFDALKAAFTFLALALVPWLAALALFAAYTAPNRSTLFH